MTEKFTLTYYERPWTTNAERSGNRWQRAANVKRWREAFQWMAKEKQIPMLTNVTITATPHLKGGKLQDVAACNPAVKAAIDGLVDAGVMEDDSPEFLVSLTFMQPQRSKTNALELEIKGERTT